MAVSYVPGEAFSPAVEDSNTLEKYFGHTVWASVCVCVRALSSKTMTQ